MTVKMETYERDGTFRIRGCGVLKIDGVDGVVGTVTNVDGDIAEVFLE